MTRLKIVALILSVFVLQAWTTFLVSQLHAAEAAGLTPAQLRCEYLVDPLGIDVLQPRLSWVLQAADVKDRGQKQTAYQILAATSEEVLAKDQGDLWDSGKVESNATIQVEYAGKPLASRMRCFWKVRVWDRDGRASGWSKPATWEIALVQPEDWKAKWINDGKPTPANNADFFKNDPAPRFRKEFTVSKPVQRARLYMAGLGYGCARLNGHDIGDRLLDPGWTDYSKRVLYSTYDVTPQVVEGRNCWGLLLGNGWYNPLPLKMWGWLNLRQHLTIGRPRVIAQLEIEYADGERQIVATDETWKTAPSPMLRNNIYLGEVYDAGRDSPDWNRPGFVDSSWADAKIATEPIGKLCAQMQPPIRVTGVLKPVKRTEPKPGVFVFDMGQNYAGRVQLRVRGPSGTKVKLRYGELIHADGTLNVMTSCCGQIKGEGENQDGQYPQLAYQSDTYILSGRGEEVYAPRFTWHGFRYVEVTGYPGTPKLDAIEGQRLSADVAEAGTFACSNERFNRIQQMTRWTFLSNLFSVQSDCPHRERFGYGGDIVATCDAFILNYDMAAFYTKTVRDFADAARPKGGMTETAPYVGIADEGLGDKSGPIGWQLAFPLLQYKLYQYYGDLRLIREQYPAARKQLEFLRANATNDIITKCIGDHESLDPKPTAITSTAFYCFNAAMVARFAELLGKQEDARQYRELAKRIHTAFLKMFFNPRTGRIDGGTQACQAFALYFDFVPPEQRHAAVEAMADAVRRREGRLATGIFGTPYLLQSLSRYGRTDLAYNIVNQTAFPGWGHMLERDATTLWEHWEFSDNVYSHNHPMFGTVSEWFIKDLGGIQPQKASDGFDRITIQPCMARGLTHAETRYNSIRGTVACKWRIASGRLEMEVSVPPNTTAAVYVPTNEPESVTEGDRKAGEAPGVTKMPAQPGAAVFQVSGGQYRFVTKSP